MRDLLTVRPEAGMGARARLRLLGYAAASAIAAAAALPGAAHAQQAAAADASLDAAHDFNLPAQPLARSITQVASIAGLQVAYNDDMGAGAQAPALRGRMSARQALERLLAGSGYVLRVTSDRVVTLVKTSTEGNDGERVTSAVSVEGTQGSPYFGGAGVAAGVNGINGSRDITATEGTGSFTSGALTIGSKVPQAMKDVPQSVSVLTHERMVQQNVTDFTTALRQLPGITLVQGTTSLENTFYSRGFAITSIQIDGGAPLSTSLGSGQGFFPQIDMSIYDHVELLRGAAGTFNGYGEPGGTVNLVRKKPLDRAQFTLEAQAGSWSNYRVVADAASPLALDGALRGRLVMTYQDRHYFYDTAKDNKTLIYGIVELDATPTTLLTVGGNYTRQDSVPWYNGLPRYLNGEDLKLPRSTSFVFPWNRWDFDTTEIFSSAEQKLGGQWTAKLNLTWNRQNSTRKVGYSNGAVNPTNGLGPRIVGNYNDYAGDQLSAEAVVTGAFMLFGQRQELTIGASRVWRDAGGYTGYTSLISGTSASPYQPYVGGPLYCSVASVCPAGITPRINVFDFDYSDLIYTEPRNPLPSTYFPTQRTVQSVAYANLRLTPFDRLHLTTGLRWSRNETEWEYEYFCTNTTDTNCLNRQIGDVYATGGENFGASDLSWPPSVTLSFDVTRQLTTYLGYTDIYRSQASAVTTDGQPLDPVTGSNWEAGLKWAPRDGKLNVSLAAYRIRQKGFGMLVGTPENLGQGRYCCYVANPVQTQISQGVDVEATGEVLPGWQVSASYTFNENKTEGSYWGTGEGLPFVSITPKHLYKLWTSYDFGAAGYGGALAGLAISGGVNGQSAGYQSGSTCVNLVGTPNPITGAQSCASNAAPDRIDYNFIVPAYAVFSGRIDYRLSDKWSLAVNLENILDKTYYQTTGASVTSGHWYGAPRSFTATIRAKW